MDINVLFERLRAKLGDGAVYANLQEPMRTVMERRMIAMSGAIRAKPDWTTKMHDAEIRQKWTAEAKDQGLTDLEIKYVLEELEYYAKLRDPETGVEISGVDMVWSSDSLIDSDLAQELQCYAAILEDIPEKLRDWHPNTNEQVLNLIHPSLYPLFYNRSFLCGPIASPAAALALPTIKSQPCGLHEWRRATADSGMGNVPVRGDYLSEKYCWLPSEFHVRDDGSVGIESYINNLHPVKHAKLYPTIANIFARFVPMFENVVTDLGFMLGCRVVPDPYAWFSNEGNPYDAGQDEKNSEDYASTVDDRYDEWIRTREFLSPPPSEFRMPDRPIPAFSFRGRRLQVIVKMSNILLTPDKPEYEGGSWHVEAMANEHIIATGIYYYDVDNITESKLNFRQSVEEYIPYEQDDERGIRLAYGIEVDDDRDAMVSQELGGVEARNGRCICFPNVYQHQVSGFKLKDPSRPGHRKILAFFLIDPSMRIPSTAIVPPQQQDWWAEDLFKLSLFGDLPLTVQKCLIEHVEWPMSLERAKEERLKLMAERSSNNADVSSTYFEQEFSLCEH
ncbi:hypothetical protein FBU59_002468 [Linderina macrospora]|uniref:Uncharacterized protein n=1 Tax=Linderina macrospora TaxID=4868 RepID=A0ACC1JBD8_9FUNG|nr:hypothetical protein FBU59_002468 [Linderina macrospora]